MIPIIIIINSIYQKYILASHTELQLWIEVVNWLSMDTHQYVLYIGCVACSVCICMRISLPCGPYKKAVYREHP